VPVDAGQHIGVAHRARLHQIHTSAQQLLQLGLGAVEAAQVGRRVFCELHQKVRVAARGVKVVCPRSRPKHLQPADAVAQADGGDGVSMLSDGGVHAQQCTDGRSHFAEVAADCDIMRPPHFRHLREASRHPRHPYVIPARAGIHPISRPMDSRLRG